jgi:hypothetical protein
MLTFDSEKLIAHFNSCKERFKSVSSKNPELLENVRNNFEQQVEEYEKRGFLSVAFVGEYSAGKSTIISALTGIEDINISADIATDSTAEYDWNGIKIIDTPGLFTDRPGHDRITHEKIKESDLLIFTLTHSLFDSITSENFVDLAYKYNYKNKMMLVVNKLSSEAGDDDEKISNYKESLQTAIAPHDLNPFPISFIDALDYLDGSDDGDEELLELSRFDTFIETLNRFTKDNNVYAKLDTPIRILGSALDEAVHIAARDDLGDNAQLELLNRITRIIRKERRRLSGELDGIVLDLNIRIQNKSSELTAILGNDSNFEERCKEAENEIRQLNESAATQVDQAVQTSMESLWDELQEVLDGKLFQEFVCETNADVSVNANGVQNSEVAAKINKRAKQFESIAQTVTKSVRKLAVKEGAELGTGLLKNADVSGSALHKGVKAVGHFVGYKFVPYEAIKITKCIGNVMKFAGPAISILTFVSDVAQVKEEDENAQKLSKARKDITATFQGIANDMENSFRKQLQLVFKEHLEPIEIEVKKVRETEETVIAKSNQLVGELISIRKELDTVLQAVN